MKLLSKRSDLALLVSRLIIGGIFITTGWMKVSDMATTIGFFAQMGIPSFLAYVVGYFELIGGVMIVLGLYTCLAAGVLGVIMLFAIWFSRSTGFQGVALPLATLGGLVALHGVCGGRYSLTRGCCGSLACGCGSCGSCACSGGMCKNEPSKA